MKSSNRVRFAPTCQVVVVIDRTKGIEDQLWYSGDDVDHFKIYSTLYAEEVKKSSLRNSKFCGAIDAILGLEKLIFKNSYYGRRRLLMSAVLEEQAWQKQCKEMWRRRHLGGDVERHFANTCIMRLASIAETNSRWAKERASVAARVLQSDIAKQRGNKSRASIVEHTRWRYDQDKVRHQTQCR